MMNVKLSYNRSGFWVQGSGFRILGSRFRVQRFRDQRFRVQRFKVLGPEVLGREPLPFTRGHWFLSYNPGATHPAGPSHLLSGRVVGFCGL